MSRTLQVREATATFAFLANLLSISLAIADPWPVGEPVIGFSMIPSFIEVNTLLSNFNTSLHVALRERSFS